MDSYVLFNPLEKKRAVEYVNIGPRAKLESKLLSNVTGDNSVKGQMECVCPCILRAKTRVRQVCDIADVELLSEIRVGHSVGATRGINIVAYGHVAW